MPRIGATIKDNAPKPGQMATMIDDLRVLRASYPMPCELAWRKQFDAPVNIVKTGRIGRFFLVTDVDALAESQAQVLARYAADL